VAPRAAIDLLGQEQLLLDEELSIQIAKPGAWATMLHVQSNPLPICTRPRVLIKPKRT
jgi:hypothetical protein